MNGLFIDAMTFSFSDAKAAFFKDFSFHCEAGKLHFIQGKNGLGKSTLFRILQGNILPGEELSATFSFNFKQEVIKKSKMSSHFMSKVKTVVQKSDDMLATQFTVEQNLKFARMPSFPGLGILPVSCDFSLLMDEFGISKSKQVSQLSGGQRQILAVIMALQKPAEVLLLDEPTAALDSKNASMIMDFLKCLALKHNLVVLIISHDAELAKSNCTGSHFELYQDDSEIRRVRILTELKGIESF